MPDAPRPELKRVTDPLAGFRGRPAISDAGQTAAYVGRVTIEIWDIQGAPQDGPDGIAVVIDPAPGRDTSKILRRLATHMPKHFNQLASDHEKK